MQKKVSLLMNGEVESDIELIALMQAFNDLNTSTDLISSLYSEAPTDAIRERIVGAKRIYCFRLICGHLNEGLGAFNRFCSHKKVKAIIERFVSEDALLFKRLRKGANDEDGIRRKYLKTIRNDASFHYRACAIKNAYAKVFSGDVGFEVVLADKYKDVRYLAADNILASMFMFQAGGSYDDLQEAMKKVRDIQFDLMRFIDIYLSHANKVIMEPG